MKRTLPEARSGFKKHAPWYTPGVDFRALANAYDRSAGGYDQVFRGLQREKFRAAAPLLADGCPSAPALGQRVLAIDAGAGTGLFAEWLYDEGEPMSELRATLRSLSWLALDLSRGMLQRALRRHVTGVVADLALPPLRPSSCALAVAFTSILEEKVRAVRALSACLAPGGSLVASFLKPESPERDELARWSGLEVLRGPLPAGQDLLFHLRRPASGGAA